MAAGSTARSTPAMRSRSSRASVVAASMAAAGPAGPGRGVRTPCASFRPTQRAPRSANFRIAQRPPRRNRPRSPRAAASGSAHGASWRIVSIVSGSRPPLAGSGLVTPEMRLSSSAHGRAYRAPTLPAVPLPTRYRARKLSPGATAAPYSPISEAEICCSVTLDLDDKAEIELVRLSRSCSGAHSLS